MATAVPTVGAVNRAPLSLNGSGAATSVPSSAFLGINLKKTVSSRFGNSKVYSSGSFKVVAETNEEKPKKKDKWKGLAYDISDDQQDITRGKGMVDTLFQAPSGSGTHDPIMSSYDYISTGLRQYNMDNNMDGFYIAPAFMDKLVVHITKNFMTLPNIKIPLILGIWGGKGQGKSFQCELVFAKMGINPIMMSAGELESGNAGEPAKLIRQRYREAADIIKKGKMCCLFINDLDAGAGRMGGTTQYTVNNQMVNATLMNIADNPTNVQLPGMYNKEDNPRVPIIVTGNDFSTLYAPLIRDGRMEKFYWAPTREDRIGVCIGIFKSDNVPTEGIVKIVDTFPGQSIDFFGALRARVYDDEVRKWISGVGVDGIGKKLVNSKDGPPVFANMDDPVTNITTTTSATAESPEHHQTTTSDSFSDPLTTTTTTTTATSTNQILSLNDLSPELSSLHDLATRGSWRSILDKVVRARKLSLLSTFPHHHLTYTSYYVLALTKLRRYDDAFAELSTLNDLDSPDHLYDSYPDLYPNRSGSMVPFSLRWIHAQLPLRLGQRQETLDRLYILLDLIRNKIKDKESKNLSSESVNVWKKREGFVINSIIGLHLNQKEYNVCLELIKELVKTDTFNPVLLSKLGYIQMQLGDLDGAKSVFDRVERLNDEQKSGELLSEIEFRNLVNRNKALMYMVAKDYVSAVREYEGCIERDGTDVVAINNKAICLMYLRDLSDSIKVLENALERVPTVALNETLVVNLCSMYELAYVNHSDIKRTLSNWIARVAPDDFDSSCTRT